MDSIIVRSFNPVMAFITTGCGRRLESIFKIGQGRNLEPGFPSPINDAVLSCGVTRHYFYLPKGFVPLRLLYANV
ncbi:MAG: hypothetical protein KDC65_18455, partial [Saprospiraceae bacterium]|nr:hypothetical protein [Saprospiraceae bacterium]